MRRSKLSKSMARVICNVNELRRIPLSVSSRFRLLGKLLEIYELKDSYFVCKLMIGNLPDLSNESATVAIEAIVSSDVYSRIPLPLQDGHGIDVYLGVVTFKETRKLEILDIRLLSLNDIKSLRKFIGTEEGRKLMR